MTAYSTTPAPGFGTLEYFNRQAARWYGLMQRTAMQFAGGTPAAGEIARAWREALEAEHEPPFLGLFQEALPGVLQEAGLHELQRWLQVPAFGLTREHQERWQALALAQQEYQRQAAAYQALLAEASQRAFALFERRLRELESAGKRIGQLRGLFDLWIDAAEQAYADAALSPRFRSVYGALVNAQMRVQAGIQREVEQFCARFGMPTRTEIDAAHRRINQLERAMRRDGKGRDAAAGEAARDGQARPVRRARGKAASGAGRPRAAATRPPAGAKPRRSAASAAGAAAKAPTAATKAPPRPAAAGAKARKPAVAAGPSGKAAAGARGSAAARKRAGRKAAAAARPAPAPKPRAKSKAKPVRAVRAGRGR